MGVSSGKNRVSQFSSPARLYAVRGSIPGPGFEKRSRVLSPGEFSSPESVYTVAIQSRHSPGFSRINRGFSSRLTTGRNVTCGQEIFLPRQCIHRPPQSTAQRGEVNVLLLSACGQRWEVTWLKSGSSTIGPGSTLASIAGILWRTASMGALSRTTTKLTMGSTG